MDDIMEKIYAYCVYGRGWLTATRFWMAIPFYIIAAWIGGSTFTLFNYRMLQAIDADEKMSD